MSDYREKLIKAVMSKNCKEAAMICINSSASNLCDNKKIDLCVPFVILHESKQVKGLEYDRYEAIHKAWKEDCDKCKTCIVKNCHSIRGRDPYYIPDMCLAFSIINKIKHGRIN